MPKVELKPCPFCGAKAFRLHSPDMNRQFRVMCNRLHCGCEGPPRDTPRQADNAWNRRAKEDKP